MPKAWTESSDSCQLVRAPHLTVPHHACVESTQVGRASRCVAGVRTNDLHTAGFVLMLMDVAIRFSKAGSVKVVDADGNEQVRQTLQCI